MKCALAAAPKFDYLCWDLYARVTQWLAEDRARLELRSKTLKEIEEGHGDVAKEMADVVATAIVQCHLRTLDRLGIDYDLLSRESEILNLKFWDAAFELLKQRNAIQLATSGKNAGCWVMQLPSDKPAAEGDAAAALATDSPERTAPRKPKPKLSCGRPERSPMSAKTSQTTSGSSACSTAIFITANFTDIPTATKSGPPTRNRVSRVPRRSGTHMKSST